MRSGVWTAPKGEILRQAWGAGQGRTHRPGQRSGHLTIRLALGLPPAAIHPYGRPQITLPRLQLELRCERRTWARRT